MIEILVAIAILVIVSASLLGLISFSLGAASLTKQTTKANALAQEAMEATRTIRDRNWSEITNGQYGITNVGGYWDFDGVENTINGFTRTVLIEDVRRDANDNIVESGGISDPNTKKATVTVSWQERGRTHQIELVTYFTDWQQ